MCVLVCTVRFKRCDALLLVSPTKWPTQDQDPGISHASFELQFDVFAQPWAKCKLVNVLLGEFWMQGRREGGTEGMLTCCLHCTSTSSALLHASMRHV